MTEPAGVDRSPLPVEFYREHWGDMPAPKFSTRRDFRAPTLGTDEGAFARIWLGAPYMPFQQYVADVAGELRVNSRGLWVPRYRKVVLLAQRQVGKTHQSMARNGSRCLGRPRWRSFYTAQTGQDARTQFLKSYNNLVANDAPMAAIVRLKQGKGDEVMIFPNGSDMRPRPPTREKMHGEQSDGDDIDEAWAFSREEGEELTQAGGPTKLTRPFAQTWIMSAGGTAESTWLADMVAGGRAGDDPAVCYIEFGIPEGADAEDLDLIASFHPAYGHTVDMDGLIAMRADFGKDAAGWARAAGNVWTEIIGGAISAEAWTAVQHPAPIPDHAPVAMATARAADGSEVAIVAAAKVGHEIVCEVLDLMPTSFGAAELARWHAEGHELGVSQNGPSSALCRELVKLKTRRLKPFGGPEESAAVVHALDGIAAGVLKFRHHPAFDAAQKVAGTRPTGDGGKAWARVAAGASIATLEAAGQAAWLVAQNRSVGKPRIR